MSERKNKPRAPRTSRTVLVVEDEKNQRHMLIRALTEMEFEVTAVASAEEARACLDTLQPTIAMLDLNLPGISGLEFAGELQKRLPQTQLIILTGYGDLETARQAIRLDVVDFLIKPCPLGELEAAISRAYLKATPAPPHVTPPHVTPTPHTLPTPVPPHPPTTTTPTTPHTHLDTLDTAERRLITDALARHGGNRTAVAGELGISVRTLYYRLARYQAEDQRQAPNPDVS